MQHWPGKQGYLHPLSTWLVAEVPLAGEYNESCELGGNSRLCYGHFLLAWTAKNVVTEILFRKYPYFRNLPVRLEVKRVSSMLLFRWHSQKKVRVKLGPQYLKQYRANLWQCRLRCMIDSPKVAGLRPQQKHSWSSQSTSNNSISNSKYFVTRT